MKYELALQLKNAGFPQKGMDCNWLMNNEKDSEIYAPTLSELIESCGDNIVIHGPHTPDIGEYYWSSPKEVWSAYETSNPHNTIEGHGISIEEGLANLWLAIHSQKEVADNQE